MATKLDKDTNDFARGAETKYDIPPGLLAAALEEGGKLTPEASKRIREQYGIDASLSSQNEIEVAAIAMQDALARNHGNRGLALAEFHSGSSRESWGKETRQFVGRARRRSAAGLTMGADVGARGDARPMTASRPDPAPSAQASAPSTAPQGVTLATQTEAPKPEGAPLVAGQRALADYADGSMPYEDRQQFERMVNDGGLIVPQGFKVGATQAPGLLERATAIPGQIKEAITGDKRKTADTENAADFSQAPSWEQLGGLSKVVAATSSPAEAIQILQSQVPGIQTRQDAKGNILFTDPADGIEYGVKPGLGWSDVPRIAGLAAAFTPAGAAGRLVVGTGAKAIAKRALLEGGAAAVTQTGLEAAQAAAGGNFDPQEIGLAAATGPVPGLLGAGARAAAPATRALANAALDAVPGSTTRRALDAVEGTATMVDAPVAQAAAQGADDATRQVVPTAVQAAPDVAAVAPVAASVDSTATRALPQQGTSLPAASRIRNPDGGVNYQELAALSSRAARDDAAGMAAKEELGALLAVNKDAADIARNLDVQLPADVLGDSIPLKESIGQLRAQSGSEASRAWAETAAKAQGRVDEVLADLGAAQSPAEVSSRVKQSLDAARADLEAAAQSSYEIVDQSVKRTDRVTLDNLSRVLAERKAELGGVLSGPERQLEALAQRAVVQPGIPTKEGVARATMGALKEEKEALRRALSRMESPYGSANESTLKRYQSALVEDELANVARLGGDDVAAQARAGNQAWAQKKALEDKIVSLYGQDGNGSIANLLQEAINGAGKGSVTKLTKLLEGVPQELQGDVLMTGLASASRGRGAANAGGISFDKFAANFAALRAKGNEPVWALIAKSVGPERAKALQGVYVLSKRIGDAQRAIPRTGASNQPLLQALNASRFVDRVVGNGLGRQAVSAGAAALGGAVGAGPGAAVAAAASQGVLGAISKASGEQAQLVGKMLSSPEFLDVAIAAGTKANVPSAAVKKLARGEAFRRFADSVDLPRDITTRERYLLDALSVSGQVARGSRPEGS